MKKMLLYCAGPASPQDVLNRRLHCSKQTGSSSTKGNHHPSFLRFWNWAEENCRCGQICGNEMLLKQKPSKHS